MLERNDFETSRRKLKIHGIILMILGFLFLGFWWWGLAAIIIGIELLRQYKKDASLLEEGMPCEIYCNDIKELILQAWIGTILVIGVLAIPECGAVNRKRLAAIRGIMKDVKASSEENIVSLFLLLSQIL